jgi:hypothetical protein
VTALGYEQIGGFDVAMDDPFKVRSVENGSNVDCNGFVAEAMNAS